MSSADVHGKFLWHELVTTDPGAASAFYSKVLGWKAQPWEKDPTYTVWIAAKGPAGGAMKLPADATGGPSWVAYIAVADIHATVAATQRLGGGVHTGVTQIGSENSYYAVLADPQGGVFGVYTPSASAAGHASEFSWHELGTSDYAAAQRFYFELFGWKELDVHDMGANGKYSLFGVGTTQYGGMFNRPATVPGSPSWLPYATVPSAAKAAEAAKAAGGRVLNGPHPVPGGGSIVQLLDAQGAAIAVFEAPAAAKPAAPKAPAAKPAAAKAKPAAKKAPAKKKKAAAKKKAAKKAKPARKSAAKRKSAARRTAPRKKAAKKKKTAARRKK